MRTFNTIIIHCSATLPGQSVTAADIDRWHREKGYRCIGYHFVILPNGTIQGGRPLDEIGAHCERHNADSVGICYIGGLDSNGKPSDTRTEAQKESLSSLIWRLTLMALRRGFGLVKVRGHRDFNHHKQCPCFDARAEYD